MRILMMTMGVLWAVAAPAQEAGSEPPKPAPAAEVEVDDTLQPKVTIVRQPDQVVEEYRISGQLYMIKVIPKKGVPYYLVDADGDGDLETRRNDLLPSSLVPTWVLFRW